MRNKVMHHRAMHLWELRKLEEVEQKANALIDFAKSQLTEKERAEVRKTSEEWLRMSREVQTIWLKGLGRGAIQSVDLISRLISGIDKMAQSPMLEALGRGTMQSADLISRIDKMAQSPMSKVLGSAKQQAEFPHGVSEATTICIGNTKSTRFHLPSCKYAQRILPENRVSFTDKEKAIAQGYSPCEVCKP